MFGLGDSKGKKEPEFIFDLERDVKDPHAGRKLKEKVVQRIKEVKDLLRSGHEKERFDQFGLLLQGYTALQKVMARVSKKK